MPTHKLDEVTIGLSLLCSLPSDVIERALLDNNRETLLILAKALNFCWATTMALLFLGAKDHRITARELQRSGAGVGRLNIETTRSVLEFYQSKKNIDKNIDKNAAADAASMRQPYARLRDNDTSGMGRETIGHERIRIRRRRAQMPLPISRRRMHRWMRPGSCSKPPTTSAITCHRRDLPAGDRRQSERQAAVRRRSARGHRIFPVMERPGALSP